MRTLYPEPGIRKVCSRGEAGVAQNSSNSGLARLMAPPSIDETALIDSLDDDWRSPAQIRTRLGLQIWSTRIATALERLANRDQIERRSQETPVRKRNGGNLTIRYYRRRSPQD